jgi:hypothetical protein
VINISFDDHWMDILGGYGASKWRVLTITFAPREPSSSAIPAPMPLPEPVTSATLPSSLEDAIMFQSNLDL